MEQVSSWDTQDEGEEMKEDYWNDDDWKRRKDARSEGLRDGVMVGVVLTVVFAYIWCYFGR